MSDPFEALKDTGSTGIAPDLPKIKARARQITRRRQLLLGSSAAVIAMIAVIGTIATTGDDPERLQAAQEERSTDQLQRSKSSADSSSAFTGGSTPIPAEDAPAAETTTDRSAGTAAQPQEATAGSAAAAGPADSSSFEAAVEVREATPTTPTRFTLKVCNKNAIEVRRTFNSGQRYDFEVRHGPTFVWRWSDGQAFTQVTGDEIWKPSQCKTWTAEWNGQTSSGAPALPGQYHVTGILKSSPEQRTKPQAFCVSSC